MKKPAQKTTSEADDEPFDYKNCTADEAGRHYQEIGMLDGTPPWTGPKGPSGIAVEGIGRQPSRSGLSDGGSVLI
jgi:hypothetical protein